MVTLDQTLDAAMQLSSEEREMLINILRKREIESRRNEIAVAAREAITEYKSAKSIPQSADEVIQKLHQSLEQEGENEENIS